MAQHFPRVVITGGMGRGRYGNDAVGDVRGRPVMYCTRSSTTCRRDYKGALAASREGGGLGECKARPALFRMST